MIETVPMFRVVCDHDGCGACAQDDGEYSGWGEVASAEEEARAEDWYVTDTEHFCRDHAPACLEAGCDTKLCDGEYQGYCGCHARVEETCDHGASAGNGDGTRTCLLTGCGRVYAEVNP